MPVLKIAIAALIAAAVCVVPLAAGAADGGKKIAVVADFRDAAPSRRRWQGSNHLERHGAQTTTEVLRLNGRRRTRRPGRSEAEGGGFALIVTFGPLATDTVAREIADIPLVAGLVLSPGLYGKSGNVTGVGLELPVEQQFDWLRRIVPNARTVGVLYNPAENRNRIEAAQVAAKKRGLTLDAQEVRSPLDVPAALDALSKRADVLWSVPDTTALSPQLAKHLLLFSFRNGIPFIGLSSAWVKAGALYSLDADYREVGAQCAEIAMKVLNGASPGSVQPVPPRTVVYSLNLTTARQMKISLPTEIVRGARNSY
jgi:putative ABC transport system substrate-binding protein